LAGLEAEIGAAVFAGELALVGEGRVNRFGH